MATLLGVLNWFTLCFDTLWGSGSGDLQEVTTHSQLLVPGYYVMGVGLGTPQGVPGVDFRGVWTPLGGLKCHF